jgi:competence protein ComEA
MRWSDLFHWTQEERRALLAIVLFTGGGGLLVEIGRRYPAWTADLKLIEAAAVVDSTAGPAGGEGRTGAPGDSAAEAARDSLGVPVLAGLLGGAMGDAGAHPGGAEATDPPSGSGKRPRKERPTGPIDLNRADAATLTLLPGVGPKLAERIVQDRSENGPYRTLADLDRVKGVGPAILQKIVGIAVVGASSDSI